ncbi:hypothetical protein ACS6K7_15645 [Enterobacter chuandaensis]|uniref:hypothetical protein n=1 Tax=Enterobacter chuandaensis TaxID=2497875 RepID=UPI003BD6EC06
MTKKIHFYAPGTNDYISPTLLFSVARMTVNDDGVQWLETHWVGGGGATGVGLCSVILGALTIEVAGAGALACGVILGTGGGYVGGEYLSDKGEEYGEIIYNTVGK